MQELIDLLTVFGGPWGAFVVIVLAIAGPKVRPLLAKLAPLLSKLGQPATPAPVGPLPTPAPAPNGPNNAPILNAAVELLKALAAKRFPWLSRDAAVARFASELAQAEAAAETAAAAPVKSAEPPPF